MASPFASSSVPAHLVRGILAVAAITAGVAALRTATLLGVVGGVALGAAAMALLRGCPMCWATGLIGTVADSRKRAGSVRP